MEKKTQTVNESGYRSEEISMAQPSDTDYIGMISRFYQSAEYHKLKALQEKSTLLDIFGKSRSETIHSAMIAWLFDNQEFRTLPEPSVLFLLRLAAKNADMQRGEIKRGDLFPEGYWEKVITNNFQIKVPNNSVDTEQSVTKGRTDIVILCEVLNVSNNQKLRICIENKVDSSEHDDQCTKYYNHYSQDKSVITIYLFLAPVKPDTLSDNHFIKITYQELLDEVIYPIQRYFEKYSESTKFYLREYINTITSIKTDNILAMSKDYTELLKKFYNNNETLIFAAIKAFGDKETKEAVANIQASTKKYTINCTSLNKPITVNGHTKLAYEIAKLLAKKNNSTYLLNKYRKIEFARTKGSCTKDYILEEAKPKGTDGKYYTGDPIKCNDNEFVWCSNQWIPEKVDKLIEMCKDDDIFISKEL